MNNTQAGCVLCWLRNDLRLDDNPALAYALRNHASVLCLYIDEQPPGDGPPAAAWWLRAALLDLSDQLDGRLLYRSGDAREVIAQLCAERQIEAVYWNRRYEPDLRERDAVIKSWLKEQGVGVASFPGNLLFEPWEIAKADGSPYRVFTPFYKAALRQGPMPPHPAIDSDALQRLAEVPEESRRAIESLPQRAWMEGFGEYWQPTRSGAWAQLDAFIDTALSGYADARNLPAVPGCSRISPYLHFGQISPREIAVRVAGLPGAEDYLRELIWREFAHAILYHWPGSLDAPMDRRFAKMPWRNDPRALQAWQQGRTGIPLVDAGMRELWQTGFMHNRVRMVVASFLTKHLLIDWREGARWFEYTLLDADMANNRMGWQWCAGSGVDAAPYFRIFNPVSQGQRFDAQGEYVRRWVPELAGLPAKCLHQPWDAPPNVLSEAGVVPGDSYPMPLIDLKAGRDRALGIWESIR